MAEPPRHIPNWGPRRRGFIPTLLALLVSASGSAALAQNSIVPDATLTTPSVVTRVDTGPITTYNITGGALRNSGQFLFHSFSLFSLLPNEVGSFLNGSGVQTIFSRVTGGSPSQIDGLIKSSGTANLYLINPQGIIFGPTGAIQVGGSFVASTASAITFGDQSFAAAGTIGDAPLITSSVTPGLQFGSGRAQLKVAGKLEVLQGNTIHLAAGPGDSVDISGSLQAPSGSIEISGGAPIAISGTLKNANTGTGGGGSIVLQGSTVTLQDGGKVISSSTDVANGAAISVDTGNLYLLGGSQLISEAVGSGAGGSIQFNRSTPQNLAITFSDNSLISTSTSKAAAGGGNGGSIQIGTGTQVLTISGPGFITTETQGSGQGGSLDLNGSTISLDQTLATTETSGTGKGGQINLSANSIILSNGAKASALTSSTGVGGGITIAPSSADALSVSGPGMIETGATSSGTAGAIRIGSNSTTATTVDNGLQIKASGPNARVDLLSSGTTTVQGDSSVEATGGSITISGATKATISGSTLNATNNGSITVQGGDIAVGSDTGRTILLAGKGALAADGSESATKAPNLTLLDSSISLNAGAGKSIAVASGTTA
ncbi:MAG: filamentous hemagglutinin N-terminal domain-containing protein, partial [Synechococcaceae cyanobacterium]|nr:filamentous hemagglutinin N-terminal domain-containing protein [Synechococcaceae cyanobacterium]